MKLEGIYFSIYLGMTIYIYTHHMHILYIYVYIYISIIYDVLLLVLTENMISNSIDHDHFLSESVVQKCHGRVQLPKKGGKPRLEDLDISIDVPQRSANKKSLYKAAYSYKYNHKNEH